MSQPNPVCPECGLPVRPHTPQPPSHPFVAQINRLITHPTHTHWCTACRKAVTPKEATLIDLGERERHITQTALDEYAQSLERFSVAMQREGKPHSQTDADLQICRRLIRQVSEETETPDPKETTNNQGPTGLTILFLTRDRSIEGDVLTWLTTEIREVERANGFSVEIESLWHEEGFWKARLSRKTEPGQVVTATAHLA